jgi:pimeloyl-ACP methyl ester carboxylesterase
VHDPHAFNVERAAVRDVELAYVREGAGGFPLVLLHGWPETKRIWWRNIAPLAEAGFEVIAPDLRGFGDSGLAPGGAYDLATNALDVEALVRGVLGHERCVVVAGDWGGAIAYDLSLRFEGLVVRQVLFNMPAPVLREDYEAAGLPPVAPRENRPAADYFIRQGTDADGLAAELDTPDKRRRYVAGMYGHRFWASPGSFELPDVDFMTEPFADADSFRASIAVYEYALRQRRFSERPRFAERNATPTLVLYGPDDHVIPVDFPQRMEIALPQRIGPFVVQRAGHFLQWERPDVLNPALRYFCLDLLGTSGG